MCPIFSSAFGAVVRCVKIHITGLIKEIFKYWSDVEIECWPWRLKLSPWLIDWLIDESVYRLVLSSAGAPPSVLLLVSSPCSPLGAAHPSEGGPTPPPAAAGPAHWLLAGPAPAEKRGRPCVARRLPLSGPTNRLSPFGAFVDSCLFVFFLLQPSAAYLCCPHVSCRTHKEKKTTGNGDNVTSLLINKSSTLNKNDLSSH